MKTIAKIRQRWLITGVILVSLLLATGGATAQEAPAAGVQAALGTGITYQGRLTEGGAPANGAYDFVFQLYDAATAGVQIGGTVTQNDVAVVSGTFTALLDFGANAFTGEARWLEVAVRPGASTGSYAALTPRQPLTPAPYALALPGLRTAQTAFSPNIIGGHHTNAVTAIVYGATIAGGGGVGSNDPNIVTDNWGTVSGGRGNQAGDDSGTIHDATHAAVGGGLSNVAGAIYATVGGGFNNVANNSSATVGGGRLNVASGSHATVSGGASNVAGDDSTTVGGGIFNIANGLGSTVPGGYYAAASHYGEMAYAAGRFAVTGDAQTSLYVLRRATTTSGAAALFLDGGNLLCPPPPSLPPLCQNLNIASGRTLVFDILVVGRSDAGASAGWQVRGVIENVNGTTAFVGTPEVTIFGRDNSAWEVTVAANDITDTLSITVLGSPNTNIRWVATVRTVEVSW